MHKICYKCIIHIITTICFSFFWIEAAILFCRALILRFCLFCMHIHHSTCQLLHITMNPNHCLVPDQAWCPILKQTCCCSCVLARFRKTKVRSSKHGHQLLQSQSPLLWKKRKNPLHKRAWIIYIRFLFWWSAVEPGCLYYMFN